MGLPWGIFGFLEPNQVQQIRSDLLKLVPDWYPAESVRKARDVASMSFDLGTPAAGRLLASLE
jgi:hypothetical protein